MSASLMPHSLCQLFIPIIHIFYVIFYFCQIQMSTQASTPVPEPAQPKASKPESIKVEPWSDFPRQPYSLFSDDFVHEKLGVVKVNAKSDRATINIKETVAAEKGGYNLSDQVKLWFQVNGGRHLYAKIKSNNYLKVHYDNGVINYWNRKWNLYATVNSSKSVENLSLRLGVAHLSEACNSDNRLKIQNNVDHKKEFTWYNRTIVNHNKFVFGLLAAYEISKKFVSKNNLLLGYKHDDKVSVYVRAESDGFRKGPIGLTAFDQYFDNVKLDLLYNHDKDTKVGLETTLNIRGSHFREAQAVVQKYFPEHKVTGKVRVNSQADVSLLIKYPAILFKNIATTSVGAHGSNLGNDKRAFKFGAQIEFNV